MNTLTPLITTFRHLTHNLQPLVKLATRTPPEQTWLNPIDSAFTSRTHILHGPSREFFPSRGISESRTYPGIRIVGVQMIWPSRTQSMQFQQLFNRKDTDILSKHWATNLTIAYSIHQVYTRNPSKPTRVKR